MEFRCLAIPEVVLVAPKIFGDDRGYFMEVWERRKFAAGGIDVDFVQDNHSRSRRGVLRGLHYQVERPQGKLVRAVTGRIFDVAVDIRKSSSTFGQWVGAELSGENRFQLWIPPGFAHGFLVLSETADVTYKCTDFYFPEFDRSLAWNDPTLAIEWPRDAALTPELSDKDRRAPLLSAAELFQ